MKFAIAFAAVLAVSTAQFAGFGRPTPPPAKPYKPVPAANRVVNNNDQTANIVRYDNDVRPDGFSYVVETDNGISSQAEGVTREFPGNPPEAPVVSQGTFSWTSPEGEVISLSYVADENGYQPSGDAIPTPPAIPEDIARSLDYLAKVQKK